MAVVVDASVAAALLLPDEGEQSGQLAWRLFREGEAIVPALWWFEVCNLLVSAERRHRLPPDGAREAIPALYDLAIEEDRSPEHRALLGLAARHRLTAYDAAYLELALRRQARLATFDAALVRAARDEGLAVITA